MQKQTMRLGFDETGREIHGHHSKIWLRVELSENRTLANRTYFRILSGLREKLI